MTDDVVVVGAGPAGCVAATVLARAGVRVRLIDRARFPRDKLCGDTVNPGTLALLRRLGLCGDLDARGLAVNGMIITGEGGVSVSAAYPQGLTGRAMRRRDLDAALVAAAVAAGVSMEEGTVVCGPVVGGSATRPVVEGVMVGSRARPTALGARVVIAADGRRSTLAFDLRLASHPRRPKRWAIGGYFEGPAGSAGFGEMHIRRGRYIGVAAIPGGLTNVCVVKPARGGDCDFRDPAALFEREIERDPVLRARLGGRKPVAPPVMLGPLAVDPAGGAVDGLVFAGDAAGFIDPMTGDGLRFAVRGGELAALAALEALEGGWSGVHRRLAAARRREFGAKWRFNRLLRSLAATPAAVEVASRSARFAPWVVRTLVEHAGDCHLARP